MWEELECKSDLTANIIQNLQIHSFGGKYFFQSAYHFNDALETRCSCIWFIVWKRVKAANCRIHLRGTNFKHFLRQHNLIMVLSWICHEKRGSIRERVLGGNGKSLFEMTALKTHTNRYCSKQSAETPSFFCEKKGSIPLTSFLMLLVNMPDYPVVRV